MASADTSDDAPVPPIDDARAELQAAVPEAAETIRELLNAEGRTDSVARRRSDLRPGGTVESESGDDRLGKDGDRRRTAEVRSRFERPAQEHLLRMGFGRGRDDYATTPTVEESKAIDVNEFTDAIEQSGKSGAIWTGDREDPDWRIGVHLEGDPSAARATALRLTFTVTDRRTDEQREYDYPVPLEYTECHFGGVRPWFRCPGVINGEECTRRIGKLYCPPDGDLFLCRHCYDLGYTSSRTSGDELKRAERRFRKAHANIDGKRTHPGQYLAPPDRPKGMHHSTYESLVEDLNTAYRDWEAASHAKLVAHTDRLRETVRSFR
jgi:hypothetical protein